MTDKKQYIWKNGKLIPEGEATTHVLTHALHYGSAVFEGIRAYHTDKGSAVFKLKEHVERLFYSSKQLGMQLKYDTDDLCQAIVETLIKNGHDESYVRTLAYYGHGPLRVLPAADLPIDIIIASWPWGDYLSAKAVDVATSDYIRIHPKSTVADAKISGHYINSILAGLALANTHYHEALLLDADGYVAEGSAENIFIVKNGEIITPPKGTILVGITRNFVIEMAKDLGIPLVERHFRPEEIYTADEAFFSGTAVEVTAIRSLDDKIIGTGKIGPITEKVKTLYHEIVRGQVPQYHHTLTWVTPT